MKSSAKLAQAYTPAWVRSHLAECGAKATATPIRIAQGRVPRFSLAYVPAMPGGRWSSVERHRDQDHHRSAERGQHENGAVGQHQSDGDGERDND